MHDRPNILFITVDDQAAWTLSCQGHPNAHTPHMDQLAAGGALLEQLFTTGAVCSPSRASMLTGRYPTQTGLSPDGEVDVITTTSTHGLTPGIPTWPALLKQAGYRTALLGKWHLGHADESLLPTAHGYEFFTGWPRHGSRSRDPVFEDNGVERHFPGQYTSDVLADITMEYLDRLKDEPFALSVNFWAPHANHKVPDDVTLEHEGRTWLPLRDEDLAPWKDREIVLPEPAFPNIDAQRVTRMSREYHASIHSVDRNLGRILRHLDRLGLTDNTIVIYTSDHGLNIGHHGLWHKGNGGWLTNDRLDPAGHFPGRSRTNLFDTSIQVPGIVRWPGRIKPGTRVNESVSFVDWLPTLLAMTGVTPAVELPGHGRSFLPLMNGGGEGDCAGGHDAVFAQHRTLRACRTREWKLVRDLSQKQSDELYHLVDDSHERHNLIADPSPAAVAAKGDLYTRLHQWMTSIEDPLSADILSADISSAG